MKVPANTISQEKEIKDTHICKEKIKTVSLHKHNCVHIKYQGIHTPNKTPRNSVARS